MPPVLDLSVLLDFRSLECDGMLIVDELVRLFLEHTQQLLDTLDDSGHDPSGSTFRDALHRLKGSSASIGALCLAHLCEELEQQTASGVHDTTYDILSLMSREYERVKEALERFLAV